MLAAVWFTDSRTLEIVGADENAIALLGYPREELIGMNARRIVAQESQTEIDEVRRRNNWGSGGAHTFVRRDGSRFTALVRWHQAEYLGRICDFTIVSDVRESDG